MNQPWTEGKKELSALCNVVRELIRKGDYAECEKLVADAMGKYPHAPQPHNLMGVLFEMKDDHAAAMKHFRAAWVLDPTYLPARHNLNLFASFNKIGKYAFDESDCSISEEDHDQSVNNISGKD